jgi:hypothetical protein
MDAAKHTSTVIAFLSLSWTLFSGVASAEEVYAVSYSTGALIRYDTADPAGTRTTLLTGGSLVSPTAMVMGPDGNLYIGESGDGSTFAPRISKYEPATLTLSTVYAFSAFEVFPGSLVFQGNDLLIGRSPIFANTGPILKLTNATGGTLAVSDYTTGGSLASSPGVALAADGTLFVSDQTYNFATTIASGPVKQFDVTGSFLMEVIADGSSGLSGPTGLGIAGNILFTASNMDGSILQTDLTTFTTTSFATTGSPFESGVIAILADGSVITGSSANTGNIYHFGPDGTLQATFASGLDTVGGLAVVPEPRAFALVAACLVAGALWWRRLRSRS